MKYVTVNSKVYMIVTPVKKLFQSGLIHDVITSGRQFAVDMNTGDLTILPKEVKKEIIFFFNVNGRIDSKALSIDRETAWVQIEELIEHYNLNSGYIEFLKNNTTYKKITITPDDTLTFVKKQFLSVK